MEWAIGMWSNSVGALGMACIKSKIEACKALLSGGTKKWAREWMHSRAASGLVCIHPLGHSMGIEWGAPPCLGLNKEPKEKC